MPEESAPAEDTPIEPAPAVFSASQSFIHFADRYGDAQGHSRGQGYHDGRSAATGVGGGAVGREDEMQYIEEERAMTAAASVVPFIDYTALFATVQGLFRLSCLPHMAVPMLNAGLVPPLVALLHEGSDEAREVAAAVIYNMAIEPTLKVSCLV